MRCAAHTLTFGNGIYRIFTPVSIEPNFGPLPASSAFYFSIYPPPPFNKP